MKTPPLGAAYAPTQFGDGSRRTQDASESRNSTNGNSNAANPINAKITPLRKEIRETTAGKLSEKLQLARGIEAKIIPPPSSTN